MNLRFIFEAVVGAVCLLAILFFGSKGIAALALFAFLPIIMRIKKTIPDEREKQIFYKVGNLTFGLTVIALYIIYQLSDYTINGNHIEDYWYFLSITSIILIHGISGLIIFRIS